MNENGSRRSGLGHVTVHFLDEDRPVLVGKPRERLFGMRSPRHAPFALLDDARLDALLAREARELVRIDGIAKPRKCASDEERLLLPMGAQEFLRGDPAEHASLLT